MKKLILFIITVISCNVAFSQYNQRWFGESTATSLTKLHTFNDGLCTKKNFTYVDSNFYNAAVGTAFYYDSIPQTDTAYHELRFALTNTVSTSVIVNRGYAFKDSGGNSQSKWFNSIGRSICEVDASDHNGGYMAVGNVASNFRTNAYLTGDSDGLIVKISNTGALFTRIRVDFNEGKDILYHVIASRFTANTYYACGTSSSGTSGNLVVIKFNAGGNIVWGNSYRINATSGNNNTNSNAIGYGMCEDSTGQLLVVGTVKDADNPNGNDALIVKLNQGKGNIIFTRVENFGGSDDAYRMIKRAQDGNFLICGYTNTAGVYGMVFQKVPIGASVGVRVFLEKIIFSGFSNCRAFDLIERDTAFQYYVIGSGNSSLTQALMIRTNSLGALLGRYSYANLTYPESVALDYSDATPYSDGIRIFSNNLGAPLSVSTNAYLARTYFNGATCTDYCPDVPSFPYIMVFSVVDVKSAKIRKKTKTTLISLPRDYTSDYICNQPVVDCGSDVFFSSTSSLEDSKANGSGDLIYSNLVGVKLNPKVNPNLSNTRLKMIQSGDSALFTETEDVQPLNTVSVFPNPTTGITSIVLGQDAKNATIRIYNLAGQLLRGENNISGNNITLDFSLYRSGMYVVEINDGIQYAILKVIRSE